MRFEQQRVAGLEHDVADLLGDALAVSMHGEDRRVVARAELGLAHALSDEGRLARDDGFDELVLAAPVRQTRLRAVCGFETADLLEVDDALDDADEEQHVPRVQRRVG